MEGKGSEEERLQTVHIDEDIKHLESQMKWVVEQFIKRCTRKAETDVVCELRFDGWSFACGVCGHKQAMPGWDRN